MTHNRTFSRGTKLPLLLAGASFAFALGATSLTASDAHAFTPEYELGAFGGVHLWNPQSGLGRFDEATTNNALHHGPAFGIRLGLGLHALFMLEGELALLPTSVNNQFKDPDGNPNTDQVLAFGYRLHGLFHILTGRVRPFLLVGGGGVSTSTSNPNIIQQQTTGSVDLGAGVKVNVRPNWGLRLDARALMMPGYTGGPTLTPNGEVTLGLYGRFGELKTYTCNRNDDDGDGVLNSVDLCPKEKGVVAFRGCLNDPATTTDRDGDGIMDAQDKCPDAPETRNGFIDEDGCPDEAPPPALLPFIGTIQGVTFEADKATLTPNSSAVLDRAVVALQETPTAKLEIVGYTDNSGDSKMNHELSLRRAEAVKAYLISKGVTAARLSALGHGEEHPIADNATPEGREKNRRVEFHFVN